MASEQASFVFRAGACYGDLARRRVAGRLALAELDATVPDDAVALHAHEDAHLVLVLAGQYASTAAGMGDVRSVPALVLNPPGVEHRDRFLSDGGRFLTLSFPAAHWHAASNANPLGPDAIALGATSVARALLLRDELRHWDTVSPLAVESLLAELLLDAAVRERERTGNGPAWLDRVRERLADESEDPPSVSELARIAGVHPVYLARAFRRRFGCSPAEYLRRQRLERAVALLHDGRQSLADVAARCGFVDQSHLTHAFRRAFGHAPGSYRRLLDS